MTRLLSTGRIRCYVMYGDHTCCSRPISGAPVWTGKHPTSAGLYGTIFRPAEPVAAVRPVWWRAPSVLRKEAPSAGASRRALSVLYGCARPPPLPPPVAHTTDCAAPGHPRSSGGGRGLVLSPATPSAQNTV